MALKINTNTDANTVHQSLVATDYKVSNSLKKLSSGLRINSAKDDASGFAIANSFKAKVSSMKVASQNATEAQSMLQTADGGYSKINDILVRMKAMATQAASGQTDNAKMTDEWSAMISEIDRIADSTQYGNTALINTAAGKSVTFQVGPGNTPATDQIAVTLDSAKAADLSVDTLTIDTAANALTAMGTLDTALDDINLSMAKVGAAQNRLQYTIDNLATGIENFSASESAIRDVDMAAETTEFTKNQILQQTGMAMLAQANSAPQQVLTLLR